MDANEGEGQIMQVVELETEPEVPQQQKEKENKGVEKAKSVSSCGSKLSIIDLAVDPERTMAMTKDQALVSILQFDFRKKLEEELPDGDPVLFASINRRFFYVFVLKLFLFSFPFLLATAFISQICVFTLPTYDAFSKYLNFQNVAIFCFLLSLAVFILTLIVLIFSPRMSTICIASDRLLILSKFITGTINARSLPFFTWKSIRVTYTAEGQYSESDEAEKVATETISKASNGKLIWIVTPPPEQRQTIISSLDQCETMVSVLSKLIKGKPQYSFYSMARYYHILSTTSLSVLVVLVLAVLWCSLVVNYFYLIVAAPLLLEVVCVILYCAIKSYLMRNMVSVEIKFIPM